MGSNPVEVTSAPPTLLGGGLFFPLFYHKKRPLQVAEDG